MFGLNTHERERECTPANRCWWTNSRYQKIHGSNRSERERERDRELPWIDRVHVQLSLRLYTVEHLIQLIRSISL